MKGQKQTRENINLFSLFVAYSLCIIVYFLTIHRIGDKLLKNKGLSVATVRMLHCQRGAIYTTV